MRMRQNGFTALHVACKKSRIPVIELLLRYGAHVECTTEVCTLRHSPLITRRVYHWVCTRRYSLLITAVVSFQLLSLRMIHSPVFTRVWATVANIFVSLGYSVSIAQFALLISFWAIKQLFRFNDVGLLLRIGKLFKILWQGLHCLEQN